MEKNSESFFKNVFLIVSRSFPTNHECLDALLGTNPLSFEWWQKTSKKGDRIKKENKHVADYQALSFLMCVASKKTNIYSILLASYLLENTQNDILRL